MSRKLGVALGIFAACACLDGSLRDEDVQAVEHAGPGAGANFCANFCPSQPT